ncbi:MAG: fibronectin type III domain-containing protein, partial [Thermoplasmata archaeon]
MEAVAVGGDYVLLSWTAPAGADQYDLRYSTSGPINEANFQAATQVATSTPQAPGTTETLNVTGLIAETTYWLSLRSANAVPNWSPISNVIEVTTLDIVDPGTIVDLQVVNLGGDYAVLQWTAPGDDGNQGVATAYEVRHSSAGPLNDTNFDAGTFVPSPTPALAGSTETLNVTGLSPLTPYWFALRTADEVPNWSPVSNNAAILTLDTLPPAIVSDLQVTGSGHDYVTLQWTAPGDDGNQGTASTYDMRFSSSVPLNDTNFIAGTSVATSAPAQAGLVEALNVSGLSPQTQYWFALRSADEVPNWSPVSNNAVTTTPDTVPPARVTDLQVSRVGGEFVVLQWTAPGDDGDQGIGASYEVRYSSSGPLNETTFGTGTSVSVPAPAPSGTTESLNVTGLSPETQYWFALRTADDVPNWSPVSNSPTSTTHAIDDTPPTAGFVSPVEGAIVAGIVTVRVQASDDEGIREVAAFADGDLLGVLTMEPYVWDWSTASFEPGSHTLTAVASDTGGNLAFASVNVTLMALAGEQLWGNPPWVLAINYVPLGRVISIVFSEAMNSSSVELALNLYPSIFYQVTWSTSSAFTLVLEEPLSPEVRYLLLIDAFATDVEGESMERGFAFTFGSSEPATAPLLRNPWVWATGVLAVWWTAALVLYFRGHRNVLTLRDTL